MPEVAAQLMREGIVNHHRVEGVRRVENPVGIRRQAQQREVLLLIELINELHCEAQLRHPRRGRAAHTITRARRQRRRVRERRLPVHRLVQRQMHERPAVRHRHVSAERIHHQQRQRGGELQHVREQVQVRLAVRRAGQQSLLEGARAKLRRVRDQKRCGVNHRRAHRKRSVECEADDRAVRAAGEFHREGLREVPARARELHLRREARPAARVRLARRWTRERPAQLRLPAHAAERHIRLLRRIGWRELRHDIRRAIHEREIAALLREAEVRVQRREVVRAILARDENHHRLVRQQRHVGERPLRQVRRAVREEPPGEIHRRIAAVMDLNPPVTLAVLVLQAALVLREKLRDVSRVERVRRSGARNRAQRQPQQHQSAMEPVRE